MGKLEIKEDLQVKMLKHLEEENFINERRYAESFARGKFRNNAWGIKKIALMLRKKGIRKTDIDFALRQIDQDEYYQVLKDLMHTKMKRVKLKNILARRKKVADYLQRKGFEISLVWDMLKQEFPD